MIDLIWLVGLVTFKFLIVFVVLVSVYTFGICRETFNLNLKLYIIILLKCKHHTKPWEKLLFNEQIGSLTPCQWQT